jgi:hypothetical protein
VDAAAEHVLAWLWHGESYERLNAFVKSDGDSISMTLGVPGSHSRFSVFGNKLPLIDDRVLANWYAWERARNDDFVVAFAQHEGAYGKTLARKESEPSCGKSRRARESERNEGVPFCGGSGLLSERKESEPFCGRSRLAQRKRVLLRRKRAVSIGGCRKETPRP